MISQVLNGLEDFALPCVDDIAVYSKTWNEHLKHIDIVLTKLRAAGLKVKPSKCVFAQKTVKFLGHEVGEGKRSPSDVKIRVILDFPTPKTKTHVRQFIGLCGFYAHYINSYAIIVAPRTDFLKGKNKKESVIWNDKCEQAFNTLKNKLT